MTSDRVSDFLAQWGDVLPDLDVSPMGIVGRLTRASELTGRRVQDYFDAHGLARSEFDVLATLRRSGEPYTLSPGELTATTMSSAATISNRLSALEGRGLLERRINPDNRRSVKVSLTEAGLALVDRLVTGHLENEREMLGSLSRSECEELTGLLAKLLAGLGDTSAAN